MTKMELMVMLATVQDGETVTFVTEDRDRDGYPFDRAVEVDKIVADGAKMTFITCERDRDGFPVEKAVDVYKVIVGATKRVKDEYGIVRIEKA